MPIKSTLLLAQTLDHGNVRFVVVLLLLLPGRLFVDSVALMSAMYRHTSHTLTAPLPSRFRGMMLRMMMMKESEPRNTAYYGTN